MFIGLVFLDSCCMVETKTHVVFDRANTNAKITDAEEQALKAIDIGSDSVFYAHVPESDDESVEIECHCNDPVKDEIDVLEIAFHKGKLRKTKFAVDYLDSDFKKHHVGTYESKGESSNYEKFIFPEKIKDIKGLIITLKSNNDGSPWFAVKGIRLAKFVEKTL